MNAALAAVGLEGAVENQQVLRLQPAANYSAARILRAVRGFCRGAGSTLFDVFDGVELLNVRDDVLDFLGAVAQAPERLRHGTVHNLQHAAPGEQFVFHQRDVRFHPGGVAVHEEGDGAGRREHRDLGISIALLPSEGERPVPTFAGLFLEVMKFLARLNFFDRFTMKPDNVQHGFDVFFLERLIDVGATRIVITLERADGAGNFRRLLVSAPAHDGGKGAGQGAAFVGVVRQTVAHDQGAEVRVAQAERAEDVRVFRYPLGWVARVINDDFLRGNKKADGGFEALDIERSVLALELHQI